jgi:4-diphosphocytidyl-2-C-methyl-D-erythritol kinase
VISRSARAKINLGLKIVNKRDDGYHNIETTFTTISLADMVLFEETESGITINAPGLKLNQEENICFKAADLFKSRYGLKKGVKITLQKNIPVGGGLGGGSSDAAETLKGLREMTGINASDEALMVLSRELGCDVPFFIKGGAAYARGLGDELKFFKMPKMSLLIYYPGYAVQTRWAYEEYDKRLLTPTLNLDIIAGDRKKKKVERTGFTGFGLHNDFEQVVLGAHPDLLDVKAHILASGVFMVSLSGSGSCLYAVVDEQTKIKAKKYLSDIGAVYFEAESVP